MSYNIKSMRLSLDLMLGRALRNRNYRLFFVGHGTSLIGTWMQQVAMGWLILPLIDDPRLQTLWLGLIGFIGQIPTFLLTPLAGVMADRWNRRWLLLTTQSLAMVQAFILAALVYAGWVKPWHLIPLSVALGFSNAFDMPVRQAFIIDLVAQKEHLANAIALNSALVNLSRLIGPALAGLLIVATGGKTIPQQIHGTGICFLFNGVSYLALIAAILIMRLPPQQRPTAAGNLLGGIIEGFAYVRRHRPIRAILLLIAAVSFVGFPYITLMPKVVHDVLQRQASAQGFLMATTALGALAAVIYLSTRRTHHGLLDLMKIAACTMGLGLILFALAPHLSHRFGLTPHFAYYLSLAIMPLIGFGTIANLATGITLLQTLADDDKRGRVMSFYTLAFIGTGPFGSLAVGVIAQPHWLGLMPTIFVEGLLCLLAGFVFARGLRAIRPLAEPVLAEKNLDPISS